MKIVKYEYNSEKHFLNLIFKLKIEILASLRSSCFKLKFKQCYHKSYCSVNAATFERGDGGVRFPESSEDGPVNFNYNNEKY